MSGSLTSEDDYHKDFDQNLDIFAELVQDIDANKNLPQESGSAINEAQSKNPTDDQEPPFGFFRKAHVIVHSNIPHEPLSKGSVLWTKHIRLGYVEETFGPLEQRNYVVRLDDKIYPVKGPPTIISLTPMGKRKFEENSIMPNHVDQSPYLKRLCLPQQRSHLLNIAPANISLPPMGNRNFEENSMQQRSHLLNIAPANISLPPMGNRNFEENSMQQRSHLLNIAPPTLQNQLYQTQHFGFPQEHHGGESSNQPPRPDDRNQQMQPPMQFDQNQPLRHDPDQQMQPQTQRTRGRGSGFRGRGRGRGGRGRGPQD